MNEHNLREIELPFDHMFDEPLADGRKVMTRRPVKVEERSALARVKFWYKGDSIYGRHEGYDKEDSLPVINLHSAVGEPGDWFKHETTDGQALTFEVQGVCIERLWEIPEHHAELEGFSGTVEFFRAWAGFYPNGSQFASTENPWVWVCTFK